MFTDHRTNDEQSLLLTQAALAALQSRPSLIDAVLRTLDHWDRVAPVDSKPLRDQWRHMLLSGQWHLALDGGSLGQQLRQSSPLGRALTPQQRQNIIRACRGRSSNT